MGHVKIVAISNSAKETAAYGKFLGKRLRHVANKDTMKSQSFGVAEIHYLPGWQKRRDKHAVAAVITRIKRARRSAPLVEKHIIRLQDGSFVDQDYRGPELESTVSETQKAQLDGLRQMHASEREHNDFSDAVKQIAPAYDRSQASVAHLPSDMTAEEVAEETGTEVDSDDFFSFLDGKNP